MFYKKLIVALFSLTVYSSVYANNEEQRYTAESIELLNQLQDHIKGTLMAVAESERKAGKNMSQFYYSIELPARQITNLGLVLDVVHSSNGYKVLSVTPGSTADKLAIKSGDQVLTINGIHISDATSNKAISELHNLIPGDKLELEISSDGEYKEISTVIEGQLLPRIQLQIGSLEDRELDDSCGVVSIFLTPPASEMVGTVKIHSVDGSKLKRNKHSFQVPVGRHTIHVYRNFDAASITGRPVKQEKLRSIDVDVEANTTYYFGAQYKDTFKKQNINDWKPVVWKTTKRDCG